MPDDNRERVSVIEAQLSRRTRGDRGGLTEVLGASGLVHADGYIDEEWSNPLRGPRGVRAYREMRDNDSTIGASFHLIDSLCRRVAWEPEAAAEQTPRQVEAAEFVKSCMDDMQGTFVDLISEVMSMQWFGWAAVEKVYKYRRGKSPDPSFRSKFTDGKLGWQKISLRAQETLDRWEIEDDGDVAGFWQRAAPNYLDVFLPMEKLILFRTETTKGNPEGRSLLRNAHRSWFFLKRMQEIEAVGIERDLAGLPKLELPLEYFASDAPPEKKAQRAIFAKLLQQIRRNEHEGVCVPAELNADGKPTGFKLSLMTSGGSRQLNVSGAIERYEARIAQNLFTQFMFLGMTKTGTQALSTDLTDVFVAGVGVVLDIIEETLHRDGTSELLELNGYLPDDFCRIKHGEIVKKDMQPIAKIILDLVSAGALTPDMTLEEWLRRELRLPEAEENADGELADAEARRAAAAALRGKPGGKPAADPNADPAEAA